MKEKLKEFDRLALQLEKDFERLTKDMQDLHKDFYKAINLLKKKGGL